MTLKNSLTTYRHHGKLVVVPETLKGQHRNICLCHRCQRFKPGQDDNCPIASELFELCKKYNVVTPVLECPTDMFIPVVGNDTESRRPSERNRRSRVELAMEMDSEEHPSSQMM